MGKSINLNRHNNRWVVDGGLVNPVLVSVCRDLGADVVIAVNLNGDLVGKHMRPQGNVIPKPEGVIKEGEKCVERMLPEIQHVLA